MTALHIAFVIVTALAVLYADEQGFEWLRGKQRTLNKRKVEVLHVLVSVGLAGILLTGGLMFIDRAEYLLHQTTFLIKMAFVLALTVNGFFVGMLSKLSVEKAFANLSRGERMKVFLSGAVSVTGWVGAVVFGLLL